MDNQITDPGLRFSTAGEKFFVESASHKKVELPPTCYYDGIVSATTQKFDHS